MLNTAHEDYGHAYFYELQRKGKDVSPNHKYISVPGGQEWVDYLGTYIVVNCWVDSNTALDEQIKKAVKGAEINASSHLKIDHNHKTGPLE